MHVEFVLQFFGYLNYFYILHIFVKIKLKKTNMSEYVQTFKVNILLHVYSSVVLHLFPIFHLYTEEAIQRQNIQSQNNCLCLSSPFCHLKPDFEHYFSSIRQNELAVECRVLKSGKKIWLGIQELSFHSICMSNNGLFLWLKGMCSHHQEHLQSFISTITVVLKSRCFGFRSCCYETCTCTRAHQTCVRAQLKP